MKLKFWDLQPSNPRISLECELRGRLKRRHREPWQRGSIRLVIERLRRLPNVCPKK